MWAVHGLIHYWMANWPAFIWSEWDELECVMDCFVNNLCDYKWKFIFKVSLMFVIVGIILCHDCDDVKRSRKFNALRLAVLCLQSCISADILDLRIQHWTTPIEQSLNHRYYTILRTQDWKLRFAYGPPHYNSSNQFKGCIMYKLHCYLGCYALVSQDCIWYDTSSSSCKLIKEL